MFFFRRLTRKLKGIIDPILRRFRPWEPLEKRPPYVLKVELTNVCNANCIFCGYQYEERRKGKMPNALFEQSVKEFVALGGRTISYIPIVGEPLLDTRLPERTRQARAWGIERVYAYSNGILLYRYDIHALLTSGLSQFSISTAPFDAESFKRLYRNDYYEHMLTGIEKLLQANLALGQPVHINFLIRSDVVPKEAMTKPDYQKRIRPYINEATDIGVMLNGYDTWGGMIKQEDLFGEMKLAEPAADKSRPCKQTFTLTVLYDGRVRACGCRFSNANPDEDPLIIGNLNEQSLVEIWNGDKLKQFRRSFPEGQLTDLCKACCTYQPI
jgi:MoaA/NifB/PqqE/SkfB family radical SAM enzyme